MKKAILIAYVILGLLFVSQAQHFVGEEWGGGIVFKVEPDGLHGLIAATEDLSEEYSWWDAKFMCDRMIWNGYNDWFLPTKNDLSTMYRYRDKIGGFSKDNYWSSSEYSYRYAWFKNFDGGLENWDGKKFTLRVRAVRSF